MESYPIIEYIPPKKEYKKGPIEQIFLKNSIVFKEDPTQFSNNLESIKQLTFGGNDIYPPTEFPTIGEPIVDSFFTTNKKEKGGKITPAEAVGMLTVVNEATALAQIGYQHLDNKDKNQLKEILRMDKNEYPDEFIEGFVNFGKYITFVSELRDKYFKNVPYGGDRDSWETDKIGESFTKDKFKIDNSTVKKIIGFATDDVDMFYSPPISETVETKKQKLESKKKGAECAGKLYLEAFKLAEKRLN